MARKDCSELAKIMTKIAMNIASNENVKDLDGVVAEMQKSIPAVNREYLVDAIVEATTNDPKEADALVKKINDIRREARNDKGLTKKIDELQKHLESETLPQKKVSEYNAPDAIQQLRNIRDGLKQQLRNSDPARKERLLKSIADLEAKIDSGDIMPKPRVPISMSKELERLDYEKAMLQKKIRGAVYALKPKSIMEHIASPFNAARALITSIDLSAVFRQGGFIALGNPISAAQAIPDMFKALASPQSEYKINQEIENRELAPISAKAGLYIAPIGSNAKLSKMEEAFMSNLIEKIPFVGKAVAASQRAYTTFLNKLRADRFDAMYATLTKNGEATLDEAKRIATFINVGTGRGAGIEQAAVALNTAFFSPRYTVSRFQLLAGQPMWGGTARTRLLIAKEYAKFLIGLGVVYGIGKLAGGEIEYDPRSTDFGKIRFGKTRIDPLAGLSQTAVLLTKVSWGQSKSATTGKVTDIRGKDVPYRGDTTPDVMARFLRTKLSPMIGGAVNVLAGENVVGEPVTVGSTIRDFTVPLSFGDIYDVMKEYGIPKGAALGLLTTFGMGLQTYDKKKSSSSGIRIK